MHELRVLTGQQQGAALPLFGQQWVIGSDALCDLQLHDPGVLACHAQLEQDEQGWRLRINDAQQADAPEPDTPFTLAGVMLVISEADTPWPEQPAPQATALPANAPAAPPSVLTPAPLVPRWARIIALSMMLLLMLTVTSWILQPGIARPEGGGERMQPQLPTSQALATHLEQQLRARDLQRNVQVVRHQDEVLLQGDLAPEQQTQLARMLSNLRQNYDLGVRLRDNTRRKASALPFHIVQITAGSRANIVIDGGRRLFIGDEQDGLRLVAITASQLQFEGRDNITVKW